MKRRGGFRGLLGCAVIVATTIVPTVADDNESCSKWQYEGIELGMPVTAAARVMPPTAAPLRRYQDREGNGGRRKYPWVTRGDDVIHVTLDHSSPESPVVGIEAITRAEGGRRLPEFLWWWPFPNETNETDHVRQYVWHDGKCGVRATLTLVVANDKILISIVKDSQPKRES